MYKSSFTPSERAESVLRSGRIVGELESPEEMVERVVRAIAESDLRYTDDLAETNDFAQTFGQALDSGMVVMSTPVLTNAGRYSERPLTACTVPTAMIRKGNEHLIQQDIRTLHEQGMGTGFNLDDLEDPVEMLRFLNKVAIESATSGKEDRPVGNMAVLTVYHPKVREFIDAKLDTNEQWKFNLSLDIDEAFMEALARGGSVELQDGTRVSSTELFAQICHAATQSGDPGLVFLDRMNARNPLPGLGEYRTTAPCAEVGLLEGETCQFGYINLAKFVSLDSNGKPVIDVDGLQGISYLMTRALDDTLDISRGQFSNDRSRFILDQKRKIGIGICGVADALLVSKVPYDSPIARQLIQDMLAIINYASKEESIRLAEQRGSCWAMNDALGSNRHLHDEPHVANLYGDLPTTHVDSSDWHDLGSRIRANRTLRNVTTVALPPTGRSALVIDASTGIEPHFTLDGVGEHIQPVVEEIQSEPHLSDVLTTAQSISPIGHIAMAAALQRFSDEALSKTINMPEGSTPMQVADIYKTAHDSGMSGVTIYVDGTHKLQPKKL